MKLRSRPNLKSTDTVDGRPTLSLIPLLDPAPITREVHSVKCFSMVESRSSRGGGTSCWLHRNPENSTLQGVVSQRTTAPGEVHSVRPCVFVCACASTLCSTLAGRRLHLLAYLLRERAFCALPARTACNSIM